MRGWRLWGPLPRTKSFRKRFGYYIFDNSVILFHMVRRRYETLMSYMVSEFAALPITILGKLISL